RGGDLFRHVDADGADEQHGHGGDVFADRGRGGDQPGAESAAVSGADGAGGELFLHDAGGHAAQRDRVWQRRAAFAADGEGGTVAQRADGARGGADGLAVGFAG